MQKNWIIKFAWDTETGLACLPQISLFIMSTSVRKEKRKRDWQKLSFQLIDTWKCIKYAFAGLTAHERMLPQEEMKKHLKNTVKLTEWYQIK